MPKKFAGTSGTSEKVFHTKKKTLSSLCKCTIMWIPVDFVVIVKTNYFVNKGSIDCHVGTSLRSHSNCKYLQILNIISAKKLIQNVLYMTWCISILKVHNVAWIFSFPEKTLHALVCPRCAHVPNSSYQAILEYQHTMPSVAGPAPKKIR